MLRATLTERRNGPLKAIRGASGTATLSASAMRRAIADARHPTAAPWIVAGLVVAGILGLVALAASDLGNWIDDRAHMLGHALDRGVAAVGRGDAGALAALLGGSALYGFVHALGPGHGKVLVGGVGAGSNVTARRLVGLSLAASIAQALWAIILVYGALAVVGVSIGAVTGLAREVLAPLGAALIAGVGALMVWRTAGPIMRRRWQGWREEGSGIAHPHAHRHACGHGLAPHDPADRGPTDHDHARHNHAHGRYAHDNRVHGGHEHGGHGHEGHDNHDRHDCGCGHAHAPTINAVARLERPWDAVTLVAGIAVRPCTSALFVLALAWRAGVPLAGALAALAMGLGTATLVCLVAGSSVLARRLAMLGSTGPAVQAHRALRLAAGTMLTLLGLAMLGAAG